MAEHNIFLATGWSRLETGASRLATGPSRRLPPPARTPAPAPAAAPAFLPAFPRRLRVWCPRSAGRTFSTNCCVRRRLRARLVWWPLNRPPSRPLDPSRGRGGGRLRGYATGHASNSTGKHKHFVESLGPATRGRQTRGRRRRAGRRRGRERWRGSAGGGGAAGVMDLSQGLMNLSQRRD